MTSNTQSVRMRRRRADKMLLKFACVLATLLVAECAALSGKGLFCRDPDTGMFHPVNSTWSSSTFCGNYTCKIRKLNVTETEYTPIRQINISAVNNVTDDKVIVDKATVAMNNMDDLKDNITVAVEKVLETEVQPVKHTNKPKITNMVDDINKKDSEIHTNKPKNNNLIDDINKKDSEIDTKSSDNRYLTEQEIKSISDILHTVKKSDLNAIVDIYSLAQDIYNEMDKTTNDGIDDETVNDIANEKIEKFTKKSYWYDPMAYKGKADMEYQGTNTVPSTIPPRTLPTYFNGALTTQDFGKLPYYYPLSPFQRSSSYVHHPTRPTLPEKPRPCKYKTHTARPIENIVNDRKVDAQNEIKPSYLLPYPFAYIHHYNYSYPNKNIYFNHPYAWDYYNRQRQYQPYYNAYLAQIPNAGTNAGTNAVLINPHLQDEVSDIELKPVQDKELLGKALFETKEDMIPNWKTEPLSNQILNEARIDTSNLLKAFPFKKVKLEKVGKLINVDELTRVKKSANNEDTVAKVKELAAFKDKLLRAKLVVDDLKRAKRSADIEEVTEEGVGNIEGEYEAYLEKTTCETQAVPGYFRFGNLTQPYPKCCPQMIKMITS